MSLHPVQRQTVTEAAEAPASIVASTPWLTDPKVNEKLGGRRLIKAEYLERTSAALQFVFQHHNIVVELGAAAGIAAVQSGRWDI